MDDQECDIKMRVSHWAVKVYKVVKWFPFLLEDSPRVRGGMANFRESRVL